MYRIEQRTGTLDQAERIIKYGNGARGIDVIQGRIPFKNIPGNRIQLIIDTHKLRLATLSEITNFHVAALRHLASPLNISRKQYTEI
jgi:hypothetical protein